MEERRQNPKKQKKTNNLRKRRQLEKDFFLGAKNCRRAVKKKK